MRLWVTEAELDDDLAALRSRPSRRAAPTRFRSAADRRPGDGRPVLLHPAGPGAPGRRTAQTYEFLHATFGEYLVARLTVHALRDAVAGTAAGTLGLQPPADDDLLQALLGYPPLTARTTVLPFIAGCWPVGPRPVRAWLIEPAAPPCPGHNGRPAYRPIDKPTTGWRSTRST